MLIPIADLVNLKLLGW